MQCTVAQHVSYELLLCRRTILIWSISDVMYASSARVDHAILSKPRYPYQGVISRYIWLPLVSCVSPINRQGNPRHQASIVASQHHRHPGNIIRLSKPSKGLHPTYIFELRGRSLLKLAYHSCVNSYRRLLVHDCTQSHPNKQARKKRIPPGQIAFTWIRSGA